MPVNPEPQVRVRRGGERGFIAIRAARSRSRRRNAGPGASSLGGVARRLHGPVHALGFGEQPALAPEWPRP
eukprot:9800004-Alexandrium_andersonii.AAC.1